MTPTSCLALTRTLSESGRYRSAILKSTIKKDAMEKVENLLFV
jgi:hypothetical protein